MVIQVALFTLQIFLALAVVFLVHEGGHLLAARLFRIHVAEVSFGFGRKIWTKTDRRGTRWSARIFPFSGFVQLTDPRHGGMDEFARAPLWRRVCIVAAGPLTNIGFAFALLTVFYYLFGLPSSPPVITGVLAESAADRAGIRPGDRIEAIDGKPVIRFEDLSPFVDREQNVPVALTLRRDGIARDLSVLPDWVPDEEKKGSFRNRLGILGINRPLGLFTIRGVEGHPVKTEAAARMRLLPLRGQDATVTAQILGDPPRDYRFHLADYMNNGMNDPFTMDYWRVYITDNTSYIYINRTFARAALDAFETGGRLIKGTFKAIVYPFADKSEKMRLDVPVGKDQTFFLARLHSFIYCTAFLSVFIGFINVFIFPGLDGYMLLRYATEAWAGRERAPLYYKRVWLGTLIVIAGIIGVLNMGSGISG